ncbi:MAG: aspartate 1-decarboxylase [Sedimentisphaerales bacterium]|nr:aspartate 1-decarboxylase [Sedimentisphaerales bacterium]
MQIQVLKSKIHRAVVTETTLDYDGSITIDTDLMEAAGIFPYEKVLVADLNNGTRHETYVVPGAAGSGVIAVLGAAARLVNPRDKVIIMAFAQMDPQAATDHHPRIVLVDESNKIRKVKQG